MKTVRIADLPPGKADGDFTHDDLVRILEGARGWIVGHARVTRALMEAAQSDPNDFKARIDALDWNRRLWSALATDCADPGNSMPAPARAQIISLSIWVAKHTSAVMRKEEEIQDLIDINRLIMQGLSGGAPAEAA